MTTINEMLTVFNVKLAEQGEVITSIYGNTMEVRTIHTLAHSHALYLLFCTHMALSLLLFFLSFQSTSNINAGNEQLEKALNRGSTWTTVLVAIFLTMTLIVLLLDWANN